MRHSDFAHVGENIWDHKYLLRMAIRRTVAIHLPTGQADKGARHGAV
jgi:hypothetical protein